MLTFRNDEWVETERFEFQNNGELVTDPSEYVPNEQVLKAVKAGVIKTPLGAYDFPDGKDNGVDLTYMRSGADIEEKIAYQKYTEREAMNSITYKEKPIEKTKQKKDEEKEE